MPKTPYITFPAMGNSTKHDAFYALSRSLVADTDPSHDYEHHRRVAANALHIAAHEGANEEIVLAAALLHDVVNEPKHSPLAKENAARSAALARDALVAQGLLTAEDAEAVATAIRECSFSKGITPSTREGRVLFDADLLESTGAISLMRIFCSSGQLSRRFYDPEDPFAESGRPLAMLENALDVIPGRLLIAKSRMTTETAKRMAEEREPILHQFLAALRQELGRT